MLAVSVNYSFVDGAHFFTSDEAKWAGLCAASISLKDAWNDVAIQLNNLAKLDHGIKDPNFKPAASSFDEFLTDFKAVIDDLLAASPPSESGEVPGAIIPPQIAAWKMEQIAA